MERSEEVLEGALLNAIDLLRRLELSRRAIVEAEGTIFGAEMPCFFIVKTISDAMAHIRSCQWLGES